MLHFVVAQLCASMQDASEILSLSIQLTEGLPNLDNKRWAIEKLLFPITHLLKGLPGQLVPHFVKVVTIAAYCVQLNYVISILHCAAWPLDRDWPGLNLDSARYV